MSTAEYGSICGGCTLFCGIERAESEVKASGDRGMRAEMSLANYALSKTALNNAAEEINCQSITKDLPVVPDQMPEPGTAEAMGLATACPAFEGYLNQVNLAAQARADELVAGGK